MLLICCKLVSHIEKDLEGFAKNGVLENLLNNELFRQMVISIDYDDYDE